jgi:hypothetical protein
VSDRNQLSSTIRDVTRKGTEDSIVHNLNQTEVASNSTIRTSKRLAAHLALQLIRISTHEIGLRWDRESVKSIDPIANFLKGKVMVQVLAARKKIDPLPPF